MHRLVLVISAVVLLVTSSPAFAATWYRDQDGDGFGDPSVTLEAPSQPAGYVANGTDCDDGNPAVHPGAVEICDGADNDCNGIADDNAVDAVMWFADADGDGFGDPSNEIPACTQPFGFVPDASDCNDSNANMFPGATEICDGVDNDCDGIVDDFAVDAIFWFADADGDGFGDPSNAFPACTQPAGFVANGDDCDDSNGSIHPGGTEVCDGIDNDCDGLVDDNTVDGALWFADSDGDGYGSATVSVMACVSPPGYVADNSDCDDSNASRHPGAPEICDGLDSDCDAVVDQGCVPFTISAVTDVGNDQGRRVRVRWNRHGFDSPGSLQPVVSYSIYRRIDANLAALKLAGTGSPAPKDEALAYPPGDWDFVTQIPASGEATYSAIVGTLCDSTPSEACLSTFFVRAHHASPTSYADTPVASGSSVDNLAPNVPGNFQVAYAPAANQLTWNESEDADFRYFRVYRGATANFTPGPGNLVHQTIGAGWVDATGGAAHYKVTAVDFNENESQPAVVSPTVGVEPVGATFSLEAPKPNPSSHEVAIAFNVPSSGGSVRLQLLDAAGRLVRTLSDGAAPVGRNVVRWDGRSASGAPVAAGLYFVRLQSGTTVLKSKLIRTN